MKMNKRMMTALAAGVMVFALAGCAKKTTINITVTNIGEYEIVKIPEGFENLGKEINTMKMNVKKDGEYPIVVKGEDGTEYTIQITYKNGTATVEAPEGLECIAGVGNLK